MPYCRSALLVIKVAAIYAFMSGNINHIKIISRWNIGRKILNRTLSVWIFPLKWRQCDANCCHYSWHYGWEYWWLWLLLLFISLFLTQSSLNPVLIAFVNHRMQNVRNIRETENMQLLCYVYACRWKMGTHALSFGCMHRRNML